MEGLINESIINIHRPIVRLFSPLGLVAALSRKHRPTTRVSASPIQLICGSRSTLAADLISFKQEILIVLIQNLSWYTIKNTELDIDSTLRQ